MPRFLVYVVAKETVTYKHVVEADDEIEVRRRFEEGELLDDSGSWVDTVTEDHEIVDLQQINDVFA